MYIPVVPRQVLVQWQGERSLVDCPQCVCLHAVLLKGTVEKVSSQSGAPDNPFYFTIS